MVVKMISIEKIIVPMCAERIALTVEELPGALQRFGF
jgi:hypothetical protein